MKNYPLIDIGVNLMHKSFNEDRENVIREAQSKGIFKMILTGTDKRSSEAAAAYCKQYPNIVYSTAGFHPHNAKSFSNESEAFLKTLLSQPQVVAVGECGLDFDRDFSPRSVQEACFLAHLEIARQMAKPLFLHERKAHERFVDILKTHRDICPKSVVHCFTGTKEEVSVYLDLGCYIGITGWICDERRSDALKAALPYIPLNRLMLETDAPFLTPRNINPRPKQTRNEPAYLTHVLHKVAELYQKPSEEIAAITSANAEVFFRLK